MGTDWGRGIYNIDFGTNIRYGIISANYINMEDFEFIYDPNCPHCNEFLDDIPDMEDDGYMVCPKCHHFVWDEEEFYTEEPTYIEYKEDGYHLRYSPNTNEIWVFKSPYKTKAGFCSPCAPGAVYLTDETPDEYGYCLPDEWFFDDKAPYSYERVSE